MSNLRERFESIPEVHNSLGIHIWFGRDGKYHSTLPNIEKLTIWVNGAWFMFQELNK